ncbi:MAG: hypothetical protein AAFX79_08805 [Planctomycetota bacterium]
MSGNSGFEDSLAGMGRKIDGTLDAAKEASGRLKDRIATRSFRLLPERDPDRPRLSERVSEARERLEEQAGNPRFALYAFGAGAALVLVAAVAVVWAFGLGGGGASASEFARDAELRAAAQKAEAMERGTTSPALMIQQQQAGLARDQSGSSPAGTGGASPRGGPR